MNSLNLSILSFFGLIGFQTLFYGQHTASYELVVCGDNRVDIFEIDA